MAGEKSIFIIGAGNIGRAVVGSMFHAAGYRLTFGDAASALIESMARQGRFTVEFIGPGGSVTESIGGYGTVDMADRDAVVRAIDDTDLVACCVYAGAFDDICNSLAAAIRLRKGGERVLNVLLCVNAMGAPEYFAQKLAQNLADDPEALAYLREKTGLCQVLVIRAGIRPSQALLQADPLTATTTETGHLYIDKEAFKGHPFSVEDVSFVGRIGALMERKIYTANMMHCMLAFMGWHKGYALIPECLADDEIRRSCFAAFGESEAALAAEYGFDEQDRRNWLETTMKPVDNPNVKDAITRVAANPLDKLAAGNRFAAPALLSEKHGALPFFLARGIAYGYCYANPEDPQAVELQSFVRDEGIERAVRRFSGFAAGSTLDQLVLKHYEDIATKG